MQQPQDNDPVIITHLRKIHWITFINYWISFALLLSHGIVSGLPFPALGLVPMSISFLLACYRLIKLHKQDGQYQILLGDDQPKKGNEKEYVLALADLSIIISDLLVFIFTCLFTYPRYWRGFQALAAYGTVTLFVDIVVHGYLLLRALRKVMKKHDCAMHCPNCRAARAATESTEGERYSDIVEVTAPREGGGSSRA